MELSKVRPNQALTPQQKLSQLSEQEDKLAAIVSLLTKLGVRRQAKLATADYLVFAEDLVSFSLPDIESAMVSLSSRPRAEGETAFPEAAAIVAEVTKAGRNRRIAEAREERIAAEAREAARRRTHPEEFEPLNADDLEKMAKKLGDKFSFEKPKPKVEPTKQLTYCAFCYTLQPTSSNAVQMTPQQLRDLADAIEANQRIADMNREANMAHQAKCIAE